MNTTIVSRSSGLPLDSSCHKRVEEIDGLRGLSCMTIVIAHMFGAAFLKNYEFYQAHPLTTYFFMYANANTAITAFFIISGFVLYLPYASGKMQMNNLQDVLRYLLHRAVRLAPLYYVAGVIGFTLITPITTLKDPIREPLIYFGFLHPFTDIRYPAFNGSLWTLGIEWWLSMLVPFIIVAFRKIGVNSVVLLSIMISLVFRAYILTFDDYAFYSVDSLFGRMDDFIIGMGLAEMYVSAKVIRTPLRISIVALFCVVSILIPIMTADHSVHLFGQSVLSLAKNTITGLLIISICTKERNFLKKFLNLWIFRISGKMCYSIYVFHSLILYFLSPYKGFFHTFVYIVILIIISSVSYIFIEHRNKSLRTLFA